ncbi:MAG: tetratricopeptide repeat protein [Labilithrix sp.]|nr:tetratricopeptide repeat protein [Labilithrix sp.]MBX3223663.1 tetratricopeptide repeat protein [Labilithrix sp.]
MNSALRRASLVFLLALGLVSVAPSTTYAAGVSPAAATPVQREQAQRRFLKGRELYGAKKYEAALTELRASLDIVASPNTRLYIGRCLRDMGRAVAAYVELGRAAVEAKELVHEDARYEQAASAAASERAALEPKLAFVEVAVTRAGPETTLRVGGDEVRRGGWAEPVPVAPGRVDVVIETPGRAPIEQSLDVRAGERKEVAIDAGAEAPASEAPSPAAAPDRPAESKSDDVRGLMRPLAFATAGVAVAGLATFVVAGAMANGTYSDLEKACGNGPCSPGREGDVSTGQTQQTLANVGLGVFAAFAATSVTLFVLGSPKKDATGATARVTAGPSMLTLQGGF